MHCGRRRIAVKDASEMLREERSSFYNVGKSWEIVERLASLVCYCPSL